MASKNRWVWEAVGSPYQKSGLTVPHPPPPDELKYHFINDGHVPEAIGKFVMEMLGQGYTVHVLKWDAECHTELVRSWTHRDREYREYRTHTRLWVDFQSVPECFIVESPWVITAGAIYAIGKAIAVIIAAVGVYYAMQNLTTSRKVYEKWDYVENPDTGEWEWMRVERTEETGPPTETVIGIVIIAIVALVLIVGIGGLRR